MFKDEGRTITASIRERKTVVIVFSIAAILILSLAIYVTIGRTEGPLKIFVDDEVYLDDEFGDDFDYSAFIGREIYFVEPVKKSAFVKTEEEAKYSSDFSDLRYIWYIFDDLDIPNVVRGISKLVCSGTYEEAVMKFGATKEEGVYVKLGDEYGGKNKNGFIYEISRYLDSESGEERIEIWKRYQQEPVSGRVCFLMKIKMDGIPPVNIEIKKIPWHSGTT